MRKPLPVMSPTAAFVDAKTGQQTTQTKRYLESIGASVNDLVDGKAAISQSWEQSFLIDYPESKDYRVVVAAALARTITAVTTRSAVGTGTLTVKINSTALGGSTNSVSTTEQTRAHTSANELAAGDDIVFTLASVTSTAERFSITLSGTITLSGA